MSKAWADKPSKLKTRMTKSKQQPDNSKPQIHIHKIKSGNNSKRTIQRKEFKVEKGNNEN